MPTEPKLDHRDAPPALFVAVKIQTGEINVTTMLDGLPWFKGAADWSAWKAFLKAVYALPMSEREVEIYQRCTGRKDTPTKKAREVWVPTGRRARKTAIGALIGVWEGLQTWSKYLAPGERAVIPMMAKNKEDAQQIRDFAGSILNCRALKDFVEGDPTQQEIKLATRVDLKIRAVSLTAGRSRSVPLALLDEQAFWPSEDSAIPDEEVVAGIRPAQAHLPGALIVGLSSPYARRGLMWQAYRDHYGEGHDQDPVLVWQATTLMMHDTPQIREYVQIETEKDPVSAASEYGAEFRTDISDFVPEPVVRACVIKDRREVPPLPGIAYFAFCDPSGGTSDSMTLAVAHWQSDRAIVDYLGEWTAPFDPTVVVPEQSAVLKRYGLRMVWGDRYAGEWPTAVFRAEGITYIPADKVRSELYLAFLPLLTGQTVELLDNPRLITQLCGLERRTARGGRDSIDHRPGSHDDLGTVVSGCCDLVYQIRRPLPKPKKKEPETREEFMAEFRARLAAMALPRKPPKHRNPYMRAR